MDIWLVLLDVVVLLGGGALLGALFERARQSAIIGYLLAGVVLGPNVTHVIESSEEVLAVSELGVALLLFAIGLEFSWSRLRDMGRMALGSGTVQVLATMGIGAGAAALLGLGSGPALAIGGMVALSSTACVLRVLKARGEVESTGGERVLGILLVQDMAVVPLVLVVGVLSKGGSPGEVAVELLRTGAIGVGLAGALYVVFQFLVPRLLGARSMNTNRELPLLIAVVSGLGSGVVAHAAGMSPALGAFIAGMLLAESPFAVQVQSDISSLKTLLLTLFFTAIGMLADPMWIVANLGSVAALVATVVVGKAVIAAGALRAFGSTGHTALATGLRLGQIGEFSFVLAGIARGTLLDEHTFLLIVSTTVLTMFLTPYLVTFAPRIATKAFGKRRVPAPDPDEPGPAVLGLVVGFGPAGRSAAERIAEHGHGVVVVDQDPDATRRASALGFRAITGDACQAEVLDHAGLGRASFVVVTVPHAETVLQIVRYVRARSAALLLVRAARNRSFARLQEAGAHVVIDEEREVGKRIAEACEALVTGTDEEPGSSDA